MKGKRQPAWWALYLWCALGLVLLFGEHFVPVSAGWHKLLEGLVVVVLFGVTALWISHNAKALDAAERDRQRMVGPSGIQRSVPLTPIQSYYLDVIDTHEVARFSKRE